MKTRNHVGISSPIHDGKAKAAGALKYYGDIELPNMHYAKMVFSSVPHAIVKSVNVESAYKIDGVVEVLTCFNTTDNKFCRSRVCSAEEAVMQEQLFPHVVKFVGDRVAMVIAKTPTAAQQGAKCIQVEYEELPAAVTVEEASDPNAPKIYPEGNINPFPGINCGKKPSAEGLIEICSDIKIGALHHGAMETHGCIADYDKYSKNLTLYTPCQSVFAVRVGVADLLGLPYNKVRVLQTTMGGSFGSKQETILEPLVAAAAIAIGAPVKLIYTREEVFSSTIVNAPMNFRSRALVEPDGKVQSIEIDCTIQAGAYLTNSLDYLHAMGEKLSRIYDFPYIKFSGRAVCTNTPVSGSYRSWGSKDIAVPIEQMLWKIADTLGLDLLKIHRINALLPKAKHRLNGCTIGDCRIDECFEQGAKRFDWTTRHEECRKWNAIHKRIKKGVGLAAGAHVNGFYPDMEFANVSLKLNEDGSILANICLHDHGCGSITASKKMIAEVLQIDEEMIYIHRPDTDYNFYDYGCYGSRTVYVIGRATQNAAENLLANLRQKASILLNADIKKLIYADGCFTNPATKEQVSLSDIANHCQNNNEDIYVTEKYTAVDNPTSSGAHFVQVAVDTLTGLTKIEAYYAVYDIGQAVNPGMCRAQIGGAIQQGIGAALTEEIVYDSKNGAIRNKNFHKYHLVNIPDMPKLEIDFIEHEGDNGPFGAKSIGETAIVPATPAVLTALENALGKEITALPMTPVKTVSVFTDEKKGDNNETDC